MSVFGPLSLDKLIERDAVRLFYVGYNIVIISIVLYILGTAILPLLVDHDNVGLFFESLSVLFLWLFPILIVFGFLMIQVGILGYISEKRDAE